LNPSGRKRAVISANRVSLLIDAAAKPYFWGQPHIRGARWRIVDLRDARPVAHSLDPYSSVE
jgi:hypothetical protein